MHIKQFLFHLKRWNLPCLDYVKELMGLNCESREDADKYIKELIKIAYNHTNNQCDEDGTNTLIDLIKEINNK